MSKNKKRLYRTIICLIAFIVAIVFDILCDGDILPSPHFIVFPIAFGIIYIIASYDVFIKAVKNIIRGQVFDENFLMIVASIGAFALGEYSESVAVMIFYQIGEIFEKYAVGKSRKSISSLMDIRPDKAVVIRDGEECEVFPEEVKIGETIIVKAGEKIPLDGMVLSGNANIDTSALTGESLPRVAKIGDGVISGCIVLDSVITIRVEKEFYDSTVSKILDLVENASGKKAKAENFITAFARYYTPAVVISAILLAVVPSIFTGDWITWITRALTFLVVSCPCALVISIPLGFFGGIGGAGKAGVLVKGANYIEQLDKANIFVFDKTGTLTKGKFSVVGIYPEENRDEILYYSAICEKSSNHPVAKCISAEYKGEVPSDYSITEMAGMGIKAEKSGECIYAGNHRLMLDNGIDVIDVQNGTTSVYIAINGTYLGRIDIADEIRDDSKELISYIDKMGGKSYMLTGDNMPTAKRVADILAIKNYKSGLLPQDKTAEVENIILNKGKGDVVAFVGDGINDAPVIMRADIGISMGGVGSDSAIEAADIVLMHDNPSSIIKAKKIARKTMRIVKENIVFALAVKGVVLILGALGFANMWLAVFADVGVSVIAILNAMRALKI